MQWGLEFRNFNKMSCYFSKFLHELMISLETALLLPYILILKNHISIKCLIVFQFTCHDH